MPANKVTHKLIVVDPAHFHAALLQKEMYPELDERVSVYAPLGPELLDYLNRISLFNHRPADPTHWRLDVQCSPAYLDHLKEAPPGSIAVFSGRNRGKIDRILAALSAGMHVLADKPWIIVSADLPKLEKALDLAASKRLAAYDIMTERHEITAQLQRILVNTPEVFGTLVTGAPRQPAIRARSVHHIMKIVAGVPLRRPVWFFDVQDYGEGLSDVGTHPVDLIQWIAFPNQTLDQSGDVQVLSARHEAIRISPSQFEQVTGAKSFPRSVDFAVHNNALDYYCNNYVEYSLRGVHVQLDVLWDWEAARGGDVYECSFQGTRGRVELRQNAATNHSPEVFVAAEDAAVFSALQATVEALQDRWPGIAVSKEGKEAHIEIPERYRIGHEEHFARVAKTFFQYVRSPETMPEWERSAMLMKYYVTTKGVELAQ